MTAVTTQEAIGLLNTTTPIRICPLPSKTQSVVVKYRPNVSITCVVPPVEIVANILLRGRYSGKQVFKRVSVKSPTLMMHGTSFGAMVPGSSNLFDYQLWALDTDRDDDIFLKPYKFANVHTDGKICFGSVNAPKNLRQAFNFYWASGFNTDLSSEAFSTHTRVCPKVTHRYYNHTGCNCNGSQKEHSCSCSRKTFHKHSGCRCTTVAASTKCKGRCQETKIAENIRHCECCKAYQEHWLKVDLGQARKRDDVSSCGCVYRHKRGCSCGVNDCNCPCGCECCNDVCAHNKKCQCECCRGNCRCDCRCTRNTKLANFMKIYNEEILPKDPWRRGNDLVCGQKCWASSKSTEAVLVTGNKSLLKGIPKKYWRKDKDGNPLVIAAARKDGKVWIFESKNFTFSLPEKLVAIR